MLKVSCPPALRHDVDWGGVADPVSQPGGIPSPPPLPPACPPKDTSWRRSRPPPPWPRSTSPSSPPTSPIPRPRPAPPFSQNNTNRCPERYLSLRHGITRRGPPPHPLWIYFWVCGGGGLLPPCHLFTSPRPGKLLCRIWKSRAIQILCVTHHHLVISQQTIGAHASTPSVLFSAKKNNDGVKAMPSCSLRRLDALRLALRACSAEGRTGADWNHLCLFAGETGCWTWFSLLSKILCPQCTQRQPGHCLNAILGSFWPP